jgi:uncharacterized protein YndB with AHSA1/START domain
MTDSAISQEAVVIERTFDAPIDVIWQLWTQPEHFKNWYGPEGFSIPVAEMDVRVGGKRLVCMEGQTPKGSMKMWTVGDYTEVVPPHRLVYTESMADEHGNVMGGERASTTIVTVQLEALDGRTKMTLTHAGLPETQGAGGGWEQAFDKLARYLATVLNK